MGFDFEEMYRRNQEWDRLPQSLREKFLRVQSLESLRWTENYLANLKISEESLKDIVVKDIGYCCGV